MDQKKIDRINELSRKSKAEGLTDEEKQERTRAIQAALRGASDVPLRVAQASAAVIPLARLAEETCC